MYKRGKKQQKSSIKKTSDNRTPKKQLCANTNYCTLYLYLDVIKNQIKFFVRLMYRSVSVIG